MHSKVCCPCVWNSQRRQRREAALPLKTENYGRDSLNSLYYMTILVRTFTHQCDRWLFMAYSPNWKSTCICYLTEFISDLVRQPPVKAFIKQLLKILNHSVVNDIKFENHNFVCQQFFAGVCTEDLSELFRWNQLPAMETNLTRAGRADQEINTMSDLFHIKTLWCDEIKKCSLVLL